MVSTQGTLDAPGQLLFDTKRRETTWLSPVGQYLGVSVHWLRGEVMHEGNLSESGGLAQTRV